jgi:hypothetical protein
MQSNKIEQILESINLILDTIDESKFIEICLKKNQWRGLNPLELENYAKKSITILKMLKNSKESLSYLSIANLDLILNNLNQLQSNLIQFNSLIIDQITTHHHQFLNTLDKFNQIIEGNGILLRLDMSLDFINKVRTSLDNIVPFLDDILKKKPGYDNALNSLQELLNKQGEVNTRVLEGQANAFKTQCENTKLTGWLVSTFLFSIIIFVVIILFIICGKSISSGDAILRISSITALGFLAVFSSTQYVFNKKMKESYMFKYTALQTVNSLISANPEMKEKIITRSLETFLNEPNLKENKNEGEVNKLMVSELLSMLKSQLK